ncbi:MAG: efflux RND transporter periplasmic adaptor subunit [Opitutales bacterium]|jgi:RND family efflux transporter MFP subunit
MKSKLLISLICLGIVGVGYLVMAGLKASAPEAKKRQPRAMQVLVNIEPLIMANAGVRVEGMGLVVAAREVKLKAQVSGQVVEIAADFLEGQHVAAGTVLAQIEADDYELQLAQAQSTLELREAELELEMGFQRVAGREWQLLGESSDVLAESSSLALREPQLKQAQAMQRSAQSAVDRARLDLSRTEIAVPFNAQVLEKSVEVGSLAGIGGDVAHVVSTDSFYVRVSIPVNRVPVLEIPGGEALVSISGAEPPMTGRIISLLGDLDPNGRMARVLVEVRDPLGLEAQNAGRAKLLLGAYVTVDLVGHPMPNTFLIPRETLRNDDHVWLRRPDATLEIRSVSVLWKNRDTVVIGEGLAAGEQLITSSLSFAADGMAVTVAGEAKSLAEMSDRPATQ